MKRERNNDLKHSDAGDTTFKTIINSNSLKELIMAISAYNQTYDDVTHTILKRGRQYTAIIAGKKLGL